MEITVKREGKNGFSSVLPVLPDEMWAGQTSLETGRFKEKST